MILTPSDKKTMEQILSDLTKLGFKPRLIKMDYRAFLDVKETSKNNGFYIYQYTKNEPDESFRVKKEKFSLNLYKAIILLKNDYWQAKEIKMFRDKLIELNPKKYYKITA